MLYQLDSSTPGLEPIEIKDNRKLIRRYFYRDKEEEAFRESGKIQFVAGHGYSESLLRTSDFLYADLELFVISQAAHQTISKQIQADVEFYPCEAHFKDKILDFQVGKLKTRRPIVNTDLSTYRTLRDGTQTLFGTVYRDDLEEDFFLARDVGNQFRYAASDKFIALIQEYDLKITATPHPTSSDEILLK